MGPPPQNGNVGEGRYNRADQHVLYLSESVEGVRQEQAAWNVKGIPYSQEYCIPVQQLRIADFCSPIARYAWERGSLLIPAGCFIWISPQCKTHNMRLEGLTAGQ